VETYHQYINPECKIPLNATNIHGITDEFVNDMPFFKNIAQDFLNFIENHNIVAHNGMFDLGFLNAELDRCGFEKIKNDRL
ncbi:exonuclease domain-containing protein, partial [Escherichia coli]|uniref:exonuclease domain-containing protein n=1 Tax=Escherichia coli TaxID=562 RepID=UPI00223934A6